MFFNTANIRTLFETTIHLLFLLVFINTKQFSH
uniref:Uncharacterized protein n=1 Tax=Myoviridae sp. ctPuP5 TaxID=2823543 RepID=A0A8S5L9I9_9CAUD|nr:MAG TPA: hypothetical protein [Myoviridae sp. ctPuP5]